MTAMIFMIVQIICVSVLTGFLFWSGHDIAGSFALAIVPCSLTTYTTRASK